VGVIRGKEGEKKHTPKYMKRGDDKPGGGSQLDEENHMTEPATDRRVGKWCYKVLKRPQAGGTSAIRSPGGKGHLGEKGGQHSAKGTRIPHPRCKHTAKVPKREDRE